MFACCSMVLARRASQEGNKGNQDGFEAIFDRSCLGVAIYENPLKHQGKNDILSPFALCVGACCHHCDLMFARMFSNASLRISEAFSACFLDLCLARPNLQSQPEISIVIWYLHTKKAKNNKDEVKKQCKKRDP